MSLRKSILVLIALFAITTFHGNFSLADEEHKEAKEAISLPLDGIWHQVKQHQLELENVIQAKQLNKVHQHAFQIRDLVNAMPAKSGSLPAEKLDKVKTNVKYLATLAARLDESGDASDQAATEENYKKFSGILKNIEAQYPADALKYKGQQESKKQ